MEQRQYERSYHQVLNQTKRIVPNRFFLSERQSKLIARGVLGREWLYKEKRFWLPVPTGSLAHYRILSNLFAALNLNCHTCYLVVMHYDLPGRALV